MPNFIYERDYDDRLQEIARFLALGIKRRQVVLGGEDLSMQVRRQKVSMVWATNDLSRHALMKIKNLCNEYQVPLLISGSSEEVSEQTTEPRVKVYVLRKNFSGIQRIIRTISAD